MKNFKFVALLLLALGVASFSLATDGGFKRMWRLESSVLAQREKNEELKSNLAALRSDIHGLQTDKRVLEKVARNELGLAAERELIFVFEKSEKKDSLKR